jgi:acyl carrier protein
MSADEFDRTFDAVVLASLRAKGGGDLTEDTDLSRHGFDSMEMIKLIMDLEDALGFFWPVDTMAEHEQFALVGVLRAACRRHTGVPS